MIILMKGRDFVLATVASLTSANRIKRGLSEHGIYSAIIQTPHTLAKDGCGYSLRFDNNVKNLVEHTASELGIRIRAFYEETFSEGEKQYRKIMT